MSRRMSPFRRRGTAVLGLAALLVLSACGNGDDAGGGGQDDLPDEDNELAQQAEEIREAEEAMNAALAGPAERHRQEAEELVDEMSTEQKAGQVLVGEYQGTDTASAAELVQELRLGGMIVMGTNVPEGADGADTEALAQQLEAIQGAAEDRGFPAIISIDQEGGLVTRVGDPLTEWPAPMAHGAVYQGTESVWSASQAHRFMGEELAELGFTVDFAPNADVTLGASDPTMGSRAFSSDPQAVSELSLQSLRGLADAGVAGSAKHFPGHGSVSEDSHYTLPVQDSSLEELQARDWAPFAEVIEAGAPMIMMGHIEVPALESGVASSLSEPAYQQLRDMGHDGVVVTDALNMGAIVNTYGADQAPVSALAAGADLLLMPSDVRGAHSAVVEAVETGEVPQERLDEAAERVVALMLWQQELAAGELEAGPGATQPEVLRTPPAEMQMRSPGTYPVPGTYSELGSGDGNSGDDDSEDGDAQDGDAQDGNSEETRSEEEDSGAEETAAEGEDGDPAENSAELIASELSAAAITLVTGECEADLASEGIQIVGGNAQDQARLSAAAEVAGIPVGQGATVVLIGGSQAVPGGDVAVALDRPEALDGATAQTQIALYGRTPASFEALVDVLAGETAPGQLPVPVGEHEPGTSSC